MRLHVRVTEPLMKFDPELNTIDVNVKQFASDPFKVFDVPDTAFWRKLVMDGLLALVPDQELKPVKSQESEQTIPAQVRENRRKRK